MKKPTTPLALSLLAALITLSQASAAIIALDDFSYADGALAGNGSAADTGWDEAWRDAYTANASAGVIVTDGVVTSDDSTRNVRNLTDALGEDGTSVFIGIDHTIGAYFSAVEFYNGSDAAGDRNFYLGQNGGARGLYTKVGGDDGAAVTSDSTAIERYVIGITYGIGNADTAELFRNGISLGITASASDLSFDRIAFAAFIGPTTLLLATDNLIIATTYDEAFAIPEPGTYALLAGLTGLVFVMLRRRR